MTRKQAEKFANAIRLVADRAGTEWETTDIMTSDIAAVLKKPSYEVEEAIATNGAAIWGCLPMGWGLRRRGASGITVTRPSRQEGCP